MPPKKNSFLLPVVPMNVGTYQTTVQFKLSPEDLKPPEKKDPKADSRRGVVVATQAHEMVESGMITFISSASFFNGLMLGDKLIKVNNETNVKNFEAEFYKGQECQCQLYRRKEARMVTPAQLKEVGISYTPGHAMFNVLVQRPSSLSTIAAGLRLLIKARHVVITRVEDKTICLPFLGIGDDVYGINGKPVPFRAAEVEPFVRDSLAALSAGQKCDFLVIRAVGGLPARELSKFIHTVIAEDVETEMAQDAIEIGREASNLHSIVLRKLTTPSILTADVKKTKKQASKTSDASESSITISTASTEMKINSDVSEGEELKPVTSKSHAVSAQNMDVGAFDDE